MNTLSQRLKYMTPVTLIALFMLWTGPLLAQGPVVLMGIDAEDGGPNGHGPISVYVTVVSNILFQTSNGGSGILVVGGGKLAGDSVTVFWNTLTTALGVPVTYVNGAGIPGQSFAGFAMIAVVSDVFNTLSGGLTQLENDNLATRQGDIASFVNGGGGLLGFSSDFAVGAGPYAYIAGLGGVGVITGLGYSNITPTPAGLAIGITDALDVTAWHDVYTNFPSFLSVLALDNTLTDPGFGLPAAIGGASVVIITDLTLDPLNATNTVGQTHTVTGCISTNGVPLDNVEIAFNVSGANTASGVCTTDVSGCCPFSYVGTNLGDDIIDASATVDEQLRQARARKTWIVPPCPTCNEGIVVVDQNVTINFNTSPPTYSGDPDLLPYFTFDTNGPTADTWKAIFDVGAAKLLIKSNATLTVNTVPLNTNNRRSPGIEIHSTCSLEVEQGGSIVVSSVNRQAGDILIQVDGDVVIDGVVSDSVQGTRGRPGNVTIGTQCGDIITGPAGRIVTYGQDFGGSDINLASCDTGSIVINGLVDASYKAAVASTINIASFGGSVVIIGTNNFGTEVVAGTLRTVTSGVSVRSRRDPLPGTIKIQAENDLTVLGSTLLSKNYPNYGAVAVKTMSNGSKGGLIDVRANGGINLYDRALDNANRFNAAAVTRALAGGGIVAIVSPSINDGASDNSKAVVNTQAGDTGKGGTNELRAFNGGIAIGLGAQVLADFTGRPGSVGANLLTACTGVANLGTVSPADLVPGDDSGVCGGSPDPLFLDCSELGITFEEAQ